MLGIQMLSRTTVRTVLVRAPIRGQCGMHLKEKVMTACNLEQRLP